MDLLPLQRWKRRLAEWLVVAAEESNDYWLRKATEAEARYGATSEHARYANEKVIHYAGRVADAKAALARLEGKR